MLLLAASASASASAEDGSVGRWQYSSGDAVKSTRWSDLPAWLSDTVELPEGLMTEQTHRGPLRMSRYLEHLACEARDLVFVPDQQEAWNEVSEELV